MTIISCKYRQPDKSCKLHNGDCSFVDWFLCKEDDKEFEMIVLVLLFVCLSTIAALELIDRGLINF